MVDLEGGEPVTFKTACDILLRRARTLADAESCGMNSGV